MSRYNRCKECYNMKCVFVTGEREDFDTSECADFRPMTNADKIRTMTDEEIEAWYWWMHKEMMYYTDSAAFVHDWLKSPVEVKK